MRRIGLVVAALAIAAPAIVALAPGRAAAQEPRTSSLSWVRLPGAESCIAAAPLAEAVEARLGREVFVSAADADLNLEGSIGPRPEGTGFLATLRVAARDGSALGSREVASDGADCAAIDEELALVVSLLIDPEATHPVTPPPPPPPAPSPPPAPAPVPPPPPPKTIEKERVVYLPAPREPFRFAVSVGFLSTLGLQPDIGLGVAPSLVLEVPGPVGVLAEGGITAATTIEAEGGARARASYTHAGLAICPLVVHPGAWSALACAGWVLGVLSADGEGFDVDAAGASIATGPWVEGRLELQIAGPLALVTSIGLVMPISRAEIGYTIPAGPKALYQTSPIAGMADIGLGLRFP